MHEPTRESYRRHGRAWVGLALALGVHVFDEAWNDFLSVYNPTVQALRERWGFFPMPTFTFEVWITGLVASVTLLLVLTVWVYRGARWTRWLSYFLSGLMFLNGVGHIAGSLYMGSWMPGVYSSPLLLAASAWLFKATQGAGRAASGTRAAS